MKTSDAAVFGVFLEGSRYSRKGFARAVNARAREVYGISLSYTHTHVGEWLRGSVPKYPEVVAAVLSGAWTVEIPPEAIWPTLAAGRPLAPSPLATPWVASLTVEEMSRLIRSDLMFDRRALVKMFAVTTGASFVDPVRQWLFMPSTGIAAEPERRPGHIDENTVMAFEASALIIVKCNLEYGGRLFRRAAIEELQEGLRLIKDARYTEKTGKRLYSAMAYLASLTGCMSFDTGLQGVAQRYFLLGLKLARESGDDILCAKILANLAEQMRDLGHAGDGLNLINSALRAGEEGEVPSGVLARLESLKGTILAQMNRAAAARRSVGVSFDLLAEQESGTRELPYWAVLSNSAEMHAITGSSFRRLARHDSNVKYLRDAEEHTRTALELRKPEFVRSHLFDKVGLARIGLINGEPEKGVNYAFDALSALPRVNSARAVTRLANLYPDTERYARRSDVGELRERLRQIVPVAS